MQYFSTLFAGAGPAGTGPLVYAAQQGELQHLLDTKIAIVDQNSEMVAGTIGRYAINSDTSASVFLESLNGIRGSSFPELEKADETEQLRKYGRGPTPLPLVGKFLSQLGRVLHRHIEQHPSSQFFPQTRIRSIQRRFDGLLCTHCERLLPDGIMERQEILSRTLVLALGGYQDHDAMLRVPIVPSLNLMESNHASKVIMTDWLLSQCDGDVLEAISVETTTPSIVVLGSSHSAFASIRKLLDSFCSRSVAEGSIRMFYRHRPKLFYPSVADAQADGYRDFGLDDICPLTQRVYRLAGLRHESKALLRQIWGMDANHQEGRVTLTSLEQFDKQPERLRKLLGAANIIIPAFGYRPRLLPIIDARGNPIELGAAQGGPLVDRRCRVLDSTQAPIPGIFGVGLASGFPITGALGGEPSFRGQSNGLWLYQNDIGRMILEQIKMYVH